MTVAQLVSQYGYAAVLVGSLLEGETVLLLAGAAAHEGQLSLPLVIALAFCGGTLGDQILFQLGRRYGVSLLQRSPKLAARTAPMARLIEHHQAGLIVGVRFMYGFRLVGPFAIGMSEVPAARFMWLNMLGAAMWAPLITGIGYLFGHALHWLIGDLASFEELALLLVVVVVAAMALHRWWRSRR